MSVLSLCFRDTKRVDRMLEQGIIQLPKTLLPSELENYSGDQLRTMQQQTFLRAKAFLFQYLDNERQQMAVLAKALDYISIDFFMDCLEDYKALAQTNSDMAAAITVKCHVHDMILKAIKWMDYQAGAINIEEPAEYRLLKDRALLQRIVDITREFEAFQHHLKAKAASTLAPDEATRYKVLEELAYQHRNDLDALQRHFAAFAHIMRDGDAAAS